MVTIIRYTPLIEKPNIESLRGKRVALRRKSDGAEFDGILNQEDDWLVGCPVVMLDNGVLVDVGYCYDLIGEARGDE